MTMAKIVTPGPSVVIARCAKAIDNGEVSITIEPKVLLAYARAASIVLSIRESLSRFNHPMVDRADPLGTVQFLLGVLAGVTAHLNKPLDP
jgi:hypothetical protein